MGVHGDCIERRRAVRMHSEGNKNRTQRLMIQEVMRQRSGAAVMSRRAADATNGGRRGEQRGASAA